MMSEQQYRLEENNQTNELILWENEKILNVFKSSYDNRKHLNIIVDKLNEKQSTIQSLKEKNDKLKELIKENVFKRYEKGSLADLEFKSIAYDDIVKLEISKDSELKMIVYCNQGKQENVKSFCRMFIPFGVCYEIKEVY